MKKSRAAKVVHDLDAIWERHARELREACNPEVVRVRRKANGG